MTDTEMLDWIEAHLQTAVGTGPFHQVACQVHGGLLLREAVTRAASRPKAPTPQPRRKPAPVPQKPYFTPHAYHRYYQRLGVHPSVEVQGEIVELIKSGKGHVVETSQKGWIVKCRIELRGLPLYVIYDHRKKQVTTLWTEAEHRGTEKGEKL